MKCFNHQDRDAVGLCKKCGKGLCVDCAVDLKHGLACRDLHEKAVEDIEALISRNISVFKVNSGKYKYLCAGFYLVLGVAILIMDLQSRHPDFGGYLMSAVFIGMGLFSIAAVRKIK